MAAATIQLYAIALLASELIEDFDVSRAQIGLLGAANTIVGAVLSPIIGGITDRIGAKRSLIAVLVGGGLSMFATALAPNYWVLIGASLLAGVPQAGGNPSTNKLISIHTQAGERGVITGIKQSGVTLSLFVAGLTLPLAEVLVDWRVGVAVFGCVFIAMAAVVALRLPADPHVATATGVTNVSKPVPSWVYRIALYGLLIGIVTAGVLRFIPLFAEEELGYSPTVAGLAASLIGLCGMAGRIMWARLAERRIDTQHALTIVAGLAAVVTVLLSLSDPIGRWILWPVALLAAFSIVSWNSVGMLAVIAGVDTSQAGRASGVVLFGFLSGLSIGARMVGSIVDRTDSYPTAWLVLLVAALLAMGVMATGRNLPRRS